MSNWAEEMSEAEWAELEEDIQATDEAYERGECDELTPENIAAWFDGIRARGRVALAAEQKKAS